MPVEPLRIEQTREFDAWVESVTDPVALSAISNRIDRLALGLPGDVESIGEGLSELRIHVGAGWRLYFVRRGDAYVLLCGGSKRTQKRDILRAKALASEL